MIKVYTVYFVRRLPNGGLRGYTDLTDPFFQLVYRYGDELSSWDKTEMANMSRGQRYLLDIGILSTVADVYDLRKLYNTEIRMKQTSSLFTAYEQILLAASAHLFRHYTAGLDIMRVSFFVQEQRKIGAS